jgi:hypothetical protein
MEESQSLARVHQTALHELMTGRWEVQVSVLDSDNELVPFDPKHLPTDLKQKDQSLRKQLEYHLRTAYQLMAEHGEQHQRDCEEWAALAYYHKPKALTVDPEWINYYPGIVMSDKPYATLVDAVPNTEAEQRYLTTQLLTGAIQKKQKDAILAKSQRLLCSLDPRDSLFFPESVLAECLKKEGLETDAKINKRLGRKPYQPIRKAERREVLAEIWEERIAELKLRYQFMSEQWREDELEGKSLRVFTQLALETVFNTVVGYGQNDIWIGVWSVLQEANTEGNIDQYYLDPRDEDTWVGLRQLYEVVRQADTESFHYSAQGGDHDGQRWVREIGLPVLYGQEEEWWKELPVVVKGECDFDDELLILGKQSRSDYESLVLFKTSFMRSTNESGLRGYCSEKYDAQLKEVIREKP